MLKGVGVGVAVGDEEVRLGVAGGGGGGGGGSWRRRGAACRCSGRRERRGWNAAPPSGLMLCRAGGRLIEGAAPYRVKSIRRGGDTHVVAQERARWIAAVTAGHKCCE